MKLSVNGEQKITQAETVRELLSAYDLGEQEKGKGIAVAVNEAVVSKNQWDQYPLNEGDRVEIIRATQGG